jgi:hypothetical protein
LIPIEHMTALKVLNLQRSDVTDKGMVRLKGLTSLRLLNLMETGVTAAGVDELKGVLSLQTVLIGKGRTAQVIRMTAKGPVATAIGPE